MTDTSSTKPRAFIEVVCFNAESALLADNAGADRVEFCADRTSGGVTPSLSELHIVKLKCKKPINVMIRPRGGNFVYTFEEFDQMRKDMRSVMSPECIADGFVFGILDINSEVDFGRNKELVALADPIPCTFHRAFDETQDMEKALEDVIACGFTTILSSGGALDAVAGAGALKSLLQKARGRIEIMPGGGVRACNLRLLISEIGAAWYHSSAISDAGENVDENEIRRLGETLRQETGD